MARPTEPVNIEAPILSHIVERVARSLAGTVKFPLAAKAEGPATARAVRDTGTADNAIKLFFIFF